MSKQWPSKEQEIWFQAGVTGEKQRIIKLLEKRKALLEDPNNHYFSLTYIQQLIKGETNE